MVVTIVDMPTPICIKDTQGFLSIFTYLGTLMTQLFDLLAPLQDLTKKASTFTWNTISQWEFDHIVSAISSATRLCYFVGSQPFILNVDVSQTCLTSTILENDELVAYESKALTAAEHRYETLRDSG